MGTWVRVSGKIDLNLYHIYDRLNEYGHPLSSYRYEHLLITYCTHCNLMDVLSTLRR